MFWRDSKWLERSPNNTLGISSVKEGQTPPKSAKTQVNFGRAIPPGTLLASNGLYGHPYFILDQRWLFTLHVQAVHSAWDLLWPCMRMCRTKNNFAFLLKTTKSVKAYLKWRNSKQEGLAGENTDLNGALTIAPNIARWVRFRHLWNWVALSPWNLLLWSFIGKGH